MLEKVYHSTDQTEVEAEKEKISVHKLKMLKKHMQISTFDYDIESDTLYVPKEEVLLHGFTEYWFEDGGDYYYIEHLTEKTDDLVRESFRVATAQHLEKVRENVSGDILSFDIPIVYETKKTRWTNFVVETILNDEGKPAYAIGCCKDINEQKKELHRVYKVAQTDALTGMRNRTTTIFKIEQRIQEESDKMHFLAVIDLDKFKSVNDLFGHSYGDIVLKNVAERIMQIDDHDTVCCRTGGDEFMFFRKCDSEEHALELMTRLRNNIRHVVTCNDQEILVEASIGLSIQPQHGVEFDDLYKKADMAMYYAKKNEIKRPMLYGKYMEEKNNSEA